MPMSINCAFNSSPLPSFLINDKRGKGCTFSQTKTKKIRKRYKKGCSEQQQCTRVKNKLSLTPALVSILESLGYKVKRKS